ncbi:HrpJ domain-containing protein [Pandoraea sputorum]|uniref:SepL/TyeA/HrpJ family type III secretion system gatekeeper n=1 Tax=Pandoraea sputorum TaxID=93222 RepID=A0A5E5BK15_9BURK|nr:HrpJ domain-containing protein [Pandoraea sputorum]VVE85688.1 SepL/TyeA/HrpJ family type III secretion system gatekeeper [Pandoraea sputorum]
MIRIFQPAIDIASRPLPDAGLTRAQTAPRGETMVEAAQAALLEFEDGALRETEENMAFALGGRQRETRRPAGKDETVRVRIQKLVTEVSAVEAAELDGILDAGPHDWLRSSQPLAALLAQTGDAAQAALTLAAWLARGKPAPPLRNRLEEALAQLAADETLALSLFASLEFGNPPPALRQELTRLYHRANAQHQKLTQWLNALGERAGRAGKLRTMMRVLAYDLSASGQPIVGSHLAAVIGDLRQLLRVLGLEAHCDQTAQTLGVPAVDGEALLRGLVDLIDNHMWPSLESVAEAMPLLEEGQHYRVFHALGRLVQLLPEDCFDDADQKAQLENAIAELRDRYAE